MIQDYKNKVRETLFNYIIDEWYGFWKWNKEKNIYTFNLEPLLLEEFSDVWDLTTETWFNYYWVYEVFFDELEELKKIWAIEYYEKDLFTEYDLDFNWYSNQRNKFYNDENYYKEFENICKEKCWTYKIHVSLEKLKLLNRILYKSDYLKLNIKKRLLKTIINLYHEESLENNLKWNLNSFDIDLFDMEIMLDEIDIENKNYIFYDIEILIYSLWLADNIHMAKFLNYLVNGLNGEKRNDFIEKIKLDDNFNYYTNEEIRLADKSKKILDNYNPLEVSDDVIENAIFEDVFWNIWYKNDAIENIFTTQTDSNSSLKVKYDYKKSLLEYNWKKVNFSQAKWQKDFIEQLYKNINDWISEDEIWKKWQQTLKDIWTKMKKSVWWWFTSLEVKQLFQTFEDGKKRYFIMIW